MKKLLLHAVILPTLTLSTGLAANAPHGLSLKHAKYGASHSDNCTPQKPLKEAQSDEYHTITMRVRITVYWSVGSGSDHWSRMKMSSLSIPLVEGSHCAVDPDIIPYGSQVSFPEISEIRTLSAVDTGGGVVSKTASNGKVPVIDIYFVKKSDALEFSDKHGAYTSAIIRIPRKPKTIAQLRQFYAAG